MGKPEGERQKLAPDALSASWCVATLGDIARSCGGGTPSKSDPSYWVDGTVPWVSPKDMKVFDLRGSEDHISEKALARLSLIPENSILVVVRSGILSRILPVAINHLPVTVNQDMRAFVPAPEINPRFIAWQLLANQRQVLSKCAKDGTTVASIEASALASFPLALPPLAEQHRVVSKIEELFSELDKGVESLRTARAQIKVYRQALLKHAFEGKLTAAWRAANRDKLESADALQARIQRERQDRHRRQLADWEAAGQPGLKTKSIEPLFPPAAKIVKELPELPQSWSWVSIEWLLTLDRKPMTTGPFGTLLSKSDHRSSGIPVLGIENIGSGTFVWGNKIFVSEEKASELESFRVQAGDIVISRSGTVGEICKLPEKIVRAYISTNLIRVSLNPNAVNSDYFVYLFQGGGVRNQVKDLCKGSSRAFLNQSILSEIKFPLPGLEEQKEVVSVLDEKLSEADQLDLTLAASLQQAEALRQSILKRAFSGKLVSQDPDDEPAAALLARIRAARGADQPPRRGRPARSPS